MIAIVSNLAYTVAKYPMKKNATIFFLARKLNNIAIPNAGINAPTTFNASMIFCGIAASAFVAKSPPNKLSKMLALHKELLM